MANGVTLGSDGVLKPGKLRWLRALLWGLLLAMVLGQALPIALMIVTGLATSIDPRNIMSEAPAGILMLLCVTWALLTVAGYAMFVAIGEKRARDELALARALPETGLGLAIGAAMMTAVIALMWLAGAISIETEPARSATRALALSIESGIVEEVLLRLIVLRLIWRAVGLWPALAFSALLFGLLHLSNPNANWFAAISIAIEAGIMLAAFYILTGRIWVSIGVHAGWNFTQGWFFGAPVSGTDAFEGGPIDVEPLRSAPEVLSGGAFGPEASFAGLIVGTLVGALTLWLAWRRGRLRAADERQGATLFR